MKKPGILGAILLGLVPIANPYSPDDNLEYLKSSLAERFGEERIERIFERVMIDKSLPSIRANAKRIDYIERGDCNDDRIDMGVEFFRRNSNSLFNAEQEYGVGGEYVTALLYLESRFGRNMGSKPIINAYVSNWLYSKSDERKRLFRGELEKLLEMRGDLYPDDDSIFNLKGSYAGCFGLPQALTSSYYMFGVDLDMDGDVDVMDTREPDDSIGFVAKYLASHGFKDDMFNAILSYNPNDGEKFPNVIICYAEKLRKRLVELGIIS